MQTKYSKDVLYDQLNPAPYTGMEPGNELHTSLGGRLHILRKSFKSTTILAVISHLSELMPSLSSIVEFTGNHWFYNSQINEGMHVMDEHLTLFSWTQVKIFYEGWQDLLQTCWSRTVNWPSRLGMMAFSQEFQIFPKYFTLFSVHETATYFFILSAPTH